MGYRPKARRQFGNATKVINKLGTKCLYCGGNASTVDHFVPWSVEKDNSDENLIPCCRRCNSIAGDKVFTTFEQKRTYILDRKARKMRLQEARCPNGCGVTYVTIGQVDHCPDCGEAL